MREENFILHCEEGCGRSIDAEALAIGDVEFEELKVKLDCPCSEDKTTYSHDVTVETEFQCTGCGTVKSANVKPSKHQLKTVKPCGECGRETEWHETGYTTIEVT